MGLDQYAGFANVADLETKDNKVVPVINNDDEDNPYVTVYDWRKHARLQEFMEKLWERKNTQAGHCPEFNCRKMDLQREDILELQKLVENDDLPFCGGGFFWGHQFQEESMSEYKEQDLKFCEDALKWLAEGKEVWYECWW